MRKYDIFEWRTVHFFRGGLSKQGGHGGQALQILTDQLTLSQPGGGGGLCLLNYSSPHRIPMALPGKNPILVT